MTSIDEISIEINSLFRDITDPITLGLNKGNFFKVYKNTYFRYEQSDDFEFNANPVLQFDNSSLLKDFLKKEKQLSLMFQEFECASEIQKLINEADDMLSLDNFYLNYTIESKQNEILVLFNTNSLIFKYEVIG